MEEQQQQQQPEQPLEKAAEAAAPSAAAEAPAEKEEEGLDDWEQVSQSHMVRGGTHVVEGLGSR